MKFFKNFLTALLALSYENPESRIEDYFRIKSAGSSNYRGATFFASGSKQPNIEVEDPPSSGGLRVYPDMNLRQPIIINNIEYPETSGINRQSSIVNRPSSIINRKIGVKTSKII